MLIVNQISIRSKKGVDSENRVSKQEWPLYNAHIYHKHLKKANAAANEIHILLNYL